MSEQGYITIATGSSDYVEMAKCLALSVKLNDPKRPIALLTDETTHIPDDVAALFVSVIQMPTQKGYVGCLNKLRIDRYSPFSETMFIDSDCFIVKNDMDRHWQKFASFDVNLAGDKVSSGSWYNFDIEDVLAELKLSYIVKMNSGVIYFKRSQVATEFFALCNQLVLERRALLSCSHRRKEQIADEPFIGTALGIMDITPVSYSPEEGSLMITTVNAKGVVCDPIQKISHIKKPTGFHIMNRIWAKAWVKHSPSIAHFVQLKPKGVYLNACHKLKEHFLR